MHDLFVRSLADHNPKIQLPIADDRWPSRIQRPTIICLRPLTDGNSTTIFLRSLADRNPTIQRSLVSRSLADWNPTISAILFMRSTDHRIPTIPCSRPLADRNPMIGYRRSLFYDRWPTEIQRSIITIVGQSESNDPTTLLSFTIVGQSDDSTSFFFSRSLANRNPTDIFTIVVGRNPTIQLLIVRPIDIQVFFTIGGRSKSNILFSYRWPVGIQ